MLGSQGTFESSIRMRNLSILMYSENLHMSIIIIIIIDVMSENIS